MDKPVIIGIDARFAIQQRRGIGNYTHHLLRYLAEVDDANTYVLYVDKEDTEGILPQQANFHIKCLAPSNYFLWEQISLPLQACRDRLDILHCTGNTAPILLSSRIKLVTTIHDVMYLKNDVVVPTSKSYYQRFGRIYRRVNVPLIARNLTRAITVSHFSKQDIKAHLPSLPEERIAVIPEAANEIFRVVPQSPEPNVLSHLGLQGDFLLTLGGLDPRKNTELVIQAFLELRAEQAIDAKLVVVGLPKWRDTYFYDLVERSPFRTEVRFTEFLDEDDLVALYNASKVFLYPSRYEGFGMPPLEAMACGVPVITSNVTSIPEIVEQAARLVDPDDLEQFKREIVALCGDETLREQLIRRGFEQIKKYSWKRMAEETLALYQSLAERG